MTSVQDSRNRVDDQFEFDQVLKLATALKQQGSEYNQLCGLTSTQYHDSFAKVKSVGLEFSIDTYIGTFARAGFLVAGKAKTHAMKAFMLIND